MIINEKAKTQQPGGAQPLVMGQNKAERPDDMRRIGPENFPLFEGLADQQKIEMLKIAQAAMDQLCRA